MSNEEYYADKMYEIVSDQYHKTRLGKFSLHPSNLDKIDSLFSTAVRIEGFDETECSRLFISKLISHNDR